MSKEKRVEHYGQYIGFKVDGKLYLQRCPECKRENYAPAVASGQCAWCGWKREEKHEKTNKTRRDRPAAAKA